MARNGGEKVIDDEKWMRRAIELARQGRGHVEPNPMVGCVIVREDHVVGEGYHRQFGGPHAEVDAIQHAGSSARGAVLYVNLEPCCHTGKTPPCTDAILRAGIRRVVVAMKDPNPQVAGKGIELLRNAGLVVRVGVLEKEAALLNAAYLKLITTGLPYVHAKWAMSLDGKIATTTGRSRWISSEQSRAHAHQLRGLVDAIVVGINTVFSDDPLLTPRPPGPRTPVRIVLDTRGRIPLESQLVRTAREAPVVVTVGPDAPSERVARLQEAGVEVLRLTQTDRCVRVLELLNELGRRQMTHVLVEGGSEVLGSFFRTGEVDEVHVYVAPKVLGGTSALTPVGGPGFPDLYKTPLYQFDAPVQTGPDVYLHGLNVRMLERVGIAIGKTPSTKQSVA